MMNCRMSPVVNMIAAVVLFVILGAASGAAGSGSDAAPYDTIVVGLGASGCAAAGTLARAGRRVLGLEAQGRLGGRVNTVPFGDGLVELGAEWIHGTESNPVYDLAVANNVTILSQGLSFIVYRSDGTRADSELVNELMTFALSVADEQPEQPEPVGQYLTKRLMTYIEEKHPTLLKDKDYIDEFLYFMDLIVNTYEATTNWNEATTGSTSEDLGGDQHASWHRYGYKSLFEILLNTYNGTGYPTLETKLNAEVTQISWSQDPSQLVRVTCRDGSTYTAQNVIVTVSLGVLKERHTTLLAPPLPAKKTAIIDRISIGVLGKIVLSFADQWWPKNLTAFGFLWNPSDRNNVVPEDLWTTKLDGPATTMGSDNTLVLWLTGDYAKKMETLPEDVVIAKSMALIRRFMGANLTISDPTAMIRSTWHSNPFTRGSYTYDNLLTPQYPTARADLGQPLLDTAGNPRVLFAGEATNPTHFGTVHGATETGYREALRLLPANTKI